MAKNKTNKIRVSFIGENAEHVTGSCTHIQMDNKQILLECGLYQSTSSVLHNYRINSAPLPFKPKAIDYIFVGHTHIDRKPVAQAPCFSYGVSGAVVGFH